MFVIDTNDSDRVNAVQVSAAPHAERLDAAPCAIQVDAAPCAEQVNVAPHAERVNAAIHCCESALAFSFGVTRYVRYKYLNET